MVASVVKAEVVVICWQMYSAADEEFRSGVKWVDEQPRDDAIIVENN